MGQQEQRRPGPRQQRRGRPRPALRTTTRAGAALGPAAGASGAWLPRRATSAARARSVSAIVSTIASSLSPLRRVATIWVVITRNPPPKMYGALNEPSDVMKVSSAAPPIAG